MPKNLAGDYVGSMRYKQQSIIACTGDLMLGLDSDEVMKETGLCISNRVFSLGIVGPAMQARSTPYPELQPYVVTV